MMDIDQYWMSHALELARQAETQNEVPIGAVIVYEKKIIAEGWNHPIYACDPTAHAEIIALRQAAKNRENYRLPGVSLYVTLEPCCMCAGALVHARVEKVIFGALDPKAGAIKSQMMLLNQPYLNHRVQWKGGILAEKCGEILVDFFQKRR